MKTARILLLLTGMAGVAHAEAPLTASQSNPNPPAIDAATSTFKTPTESSSGIVTTSVASAVPASSSTLQMPEVSSGTSTVERKVSNGLLAEPTVSTAPLAVWQTGETRSKPLPQAMTASSGTLSFTSLTGSAWPRDQLPTFASVITPDEGRHWDANTASDLLSREAGVQMPITPELTVPRTLRLRGADPQDTLVLLDGRPLTGVFLSAPDLAEIPAEQIDHVEVVRGNASALYGGYASAGVINVISKRATYNGLPISHFSLENGDYGRQFYRLDFGTRMGKLDYFFFADQQRESGFRTNSDERQHNLGGNLGLSMGSAGKFLFDAGSFHRNEGQPGPLIPSIPISQYNNLLETAALTPFARKTTQVDYLRASYIVSIATRTWVSLRAFGEQRDLEYRDPTFNVNTERHEQSKGGEAQFNLPDGLMLGTNFLRDRSDFSDFVSSTNSYTAAEENWGGFIQESLFYREWALIPSLRFDHQTYSAHSVNPRLLTTLDLTPWVRLSGSAGRAVRAPTLDQLYLRTSTFSGNPTLAPERTWNFDAGIEVHEDSQSLKATAYLSKIRDLIQVDPATLASVANLPNGKRQGLEIEGRRVENRRFEHRLNYTYLEATADLPAGAGDHTALAFAPHHTVNYLTTVHFTSKLALDDNFRFQTAQFAGNGETGSETNDRILWDLRLAYQIRQLEAYVGISDVMNRRFEDPNGYPQPGRQFYGGLTIRLWG